MRPENPDVSGIRFSRTTFLAEADAIARHPAFPKALERWGDPSLDVFDGRPRDAKLICQTARYVTLFFILHLHASADPADPNAGASVARVQACVQASGFGSASWVKLAMRTFHRSSLIEAMPPGQDRRLRRYRPSSQFLALGREVLEKGLETVALVRDLPASPRDLAGFPGVVENIARVTVDTYERDGFTNLELFPEITAFLQRDFGHLILSHLVRTLRDDPRLGPVAQASAKDLSERFGMSRAHVGNVLQMAEGLGLLERQASDRRHLVRLSPHFADLCRRWVAVDLAWLGYLAERAYAHARAAALRTSTGRTSYETYRAV